MLQDSVVGYSFLVDGMPSSNRHCFSPSKGWNARSWPPFEPIL